jgi:hypothetical protein
LSTLLSSLFKSGGGALLLYAFPPSSLNHFSFSP